MNEEQQDNENMDVANPMKKTRQCKAPTSYCTTKEVMAMFGVCRRTLMEMVEDGRVPKPENHKNRARGKRLFWKADKLRVHIKCGRHIR